MSMRPVDLPRVRDEVAAWLSTYGDKLYLAAIRAGKQNYVPTRSPERAAAILTAGEIRRVAEAELFYVSSDMTELAVTAAAQLPAFGLMPEDLPAPSGLIVFQRPIASAYVEAWHRPPLSDGSLPGGDVPIVAAAWSHWTDCGPVWARNGGGAWITFYSDRDADIEAGCREGIYSRYEAEVMRRIPVRLSIANEIQVPFSVEPQEVAVGTREPVPMSEVPDGLHRWAAVLKTAWLLMMQPGLATVDDQVFDRAARRRAVREGRELPRVRIITLRRPPNPAGSGQTDREYHHQWIVRGHWRQQWYPSRETHRPVWIAPHVKGPEGAPMLGGERVYAWTR